jgi:hypothetical protein
MIKLQRAYGGCLGARRRRRTWQAAISLGELQASFDPGISEWGNPPAYKRERPAEYIGGYEQTQGSEPSQYLEENKSTEIPIVAASELGTAQTLVFIPGGCRTA